MLPGRLIDTLLIHIPYVYMQNSKLRALAHSRKSIVNQTSHSLKTRDEHNNTHEMQEYRT